MLLKSLKAKLSDSVLFRIAVVCLTIILALFIYKIYSINQKSVTNTLKLATTHQPERFTELYFSDSENLPSTLTVKQDYTVKFTIHNVEAKDMSYKYLVSYSTNGTTYHNLNQQKIYLINNASKRITDNIIIPNETGRVEFNVQLLNMPQNIHFWAEVSK